MDNLLNYANHKFKAKISGVPVKGRVQVENGRVFLCQDKVSGTECSDKLGYKYSWSVAATDRGFELLSGGVTDFEIIYEEDEFKDWCVGAKLVIDDYEPLIIAFRSGNIIICETYDGTATIPFTCKELFNQGWRSQSEANKEEIVEVKLEAVAKLFGVPASRLKIIV